MNTMLKIHPLKESAKLSKFTQFNIAFICQKYICTLQYINQSHSTIQELYWNINVHCTKR